ncbi:MULTISPECIES: HAD-IIB family hydrolase [Staphylococcus]|uniref:HAD-IIB family hydrolase n=1 Tax=Staphylococcus equorum TaxID=246432 RepID=A0AAW7ADI6_9STAP|nr:HAD-IIB family hydrolase [Staphylococcus equorum]MDK9865058.1 HAD-IIB family hydrolase [Staphylococcus equorum]
MIIVMDVDGTICFNGSDIDTDIRSELKRLEKRHQIIFASARPIRDLLPVVRGFENKTLIGGNGSIISQNKIISVIKHIPSNEYEYLKNMINENSLNYIIDGSFDYAANVNENSKIFKQLDPDRMAKRLKMSEIDNPIKIILIGLSDKLFECLKIQLKKYEDSLSINYHNVENNIDITAKEINKYTTLIKIIRSKPYIAYGNDINDFELLKHAQKSYCVGDNIEMLSFSNVKQIQNNTFSVAESLKYY